MAHSFLIFDFGSDEEAAQQARHKLEGWKQGFRLGNKLLLKFEREEAPEKSAAKDGPDSKSDSKSAAAKKKSPAPTEEEKSSPAARVCLLVRLDFSDHEKLSHQRWLDRIPSEEPFKSVEADIIRESDPNFVDTVELFESLD